MGQFRPFRPGCDPHYIFFYSSMLWMITTNDLRQLSHFKKNFSGSMSRNRSTRVVIDSFEIYIINSLMKFFFLKLQ